MMFFCKKNRKEAATKNRNRKAILVIDDNKDVVRCQQLLLEDDGYEVITAFNGDEGLEHARNRLPDMILLDINLPTLSGFQMCRELKADPKTKHIPIIMVSGQEKMTDYVRAAQEGAVAYIAKPIHKEELLTKIRKHLL